MEEMLLPPRMFAAGDEPLGERVNSYHKIKTTRAIIVALETEEVEFLRNSTFGRILAIDDNPPFSGAFGQYVLVRLLNVNKKYEFWFLFAGKPIRMSLREFAIVTGLNCEKIPEKKKKKNPLKEKLYWNELFGSLKFCTVETAIEMLKNKVVKTRELRIKIACLAITSSILFTSSHTPRIIPDHVELIRDLDEFLAFPWGRASYHTLATSLKGKDEVALSQASFAIRGYVEAIQLIMLAAIPQLKEEVTHSERFLIVDSESEGETHTPEDRVTEADNVAGQGKPQQATKYCLIPGHAKSADSECQVPVKSILDDPYEEWSAGLDFEWVDESEDLAVDNMVRLILQGFVFRKEMFKGGLNAIDLARLRGEKKLKEKEPKVKNEKELKEKEPKDKSDKEHVVEVAEREGSSDLLDAIKSMEKRIYEALDAKLEKLVPPTSQSQQVAVLQSTMSGCLKDLDKIIGDSLVRHLKDMQDSIIKGVIDVIGDPRSTCSLSMPPPTTSNVSPVKGKEPPAFDLTTQSEASDALINDVLRGLNTPSDDSLPPTKESRPKLIDQEGPGAEDAQPQLEHIEEVNINTDQQLEANISTDQAQHLSGNATALLKEPLISNDKQHPVQEIEGDVEDNVPTDQENNQDIHVEDTVCEEAESEAVNMEEPQSEPVDMEKAEAVDMEEEDAPCAKETAHPKNYLSPPEEEAGEQRKSKRTKIAPVGLQDYKCDPKVTGGLSINHELDQRFKLIEQRVLNEEVVFLRTGYSVTPAEFCDIAHRKTILSSGVVDCLIGVVSTGLAASPHVSIYDTSLPVAIMNHHSRFIKTAVKDRAKLKFANVPLENPTQKTPERIYFPFNMDKQHWVGFCIDIKASTLHVMDCNTSLRSESSLKKELTPIANLIPYVLKQYGYTEANVGVKAFTVSRCRGIPQISSQTDAAVMIVLFIEAHAVDGLAGCKKITPRVVPNAAKQLAVKLFDDISD